MSNLGDSNTPVEGQSFGLPAGAELGEDNGDVVIKDSTGTIILRRNETASEWQFEGTDLSGINAIDASSATFDETTTGQVDGSITSDPITSLTDGELFVDSGTLTFSPSGGPEVTWLQEGSPPVSVQLGSSESTTVPSDEDWMVALFSSGFSTTIDGFEVEQENRYIDRIVLTGGTTITADSRAYLQGWDVSNVSKTAVSQATPTVPTGETWVGSLISNFDGVVSLNSRTVDFSSSNSAGLIPLGMWVVLTGGDSVDTGYFGGFKI